MKKESNSNNLIFQAAFIMTLCFFCEIVSGFLPFAIPGSILAMFILLILLFLKVVKPARLTNIKEVLLDNMALFFVPAGVSIILYIDILKEIWLALLVIIVVTTPLVFIVTGLTVQFWASKFIKQKGEEIDDD